MVQNQEIPTGKGFFAPDFELSQSSFKLSGTKAYFS
jgi:hypothetical protein